MIKSHKDQTDWITDQRLTSRVIGLFQGKTSQITPKVKLYYIKIKQKSFWHFSVGIIAGNHQNVKPIAKYSMPYKS